MTAARPPRLPPPRTRSDRLRDLARAVERLGSGWRHTPEEVLDAKATISAELR